MTRHEKKRAICKRCAGFEKPVAKMRLVVKNTMLLYVRMIAVMLIGLYTGRVLLKALGVQDYGLMGVAAAVVGMLTFLNGALAGASSRFLTAEMGGGTIGSLKRTFSTLLTVHIAFAGIIAILLETVGLIVLETKLNINPERIFAVKCVYQCSVVLTMFSITQVPYQALVIAHERMGAFAWMALYDVLTKLCIAFLISVYGGDRMILNGVLICVAGVGSIMIYRIYAIRNFTEARYRKIFEKKLIKPIFSYAGWQISAQTVNMLLTSGLVMLNQRYFGPAIVAAMAIANTVSAHIQGFIGNFRMASIPQVVKLYAAGKYDDSKRMVIDMTHISIYMILVLGVPICFYSTEALRIWLGNDVPQYASAFVKLILLSEFFHLYSTSFFQVLYAAGKIKGNAILNFFLGGSTFIGALLFMAKTENVYTACLAMLVFQTVHGLIGKPILVHNIAGYGLRDFKRVFVPTLFAFALCCVIAWSVRCIVPSGLACAIPACMAIVALNALSIYLFVMPGRMHKSLCALIVRIPMVGESLSAFSKKMVFLASPLRARLMPIMYN